MVRAASISANMKDMHAFVHNPGRGSKQKLVAIALAVLLGLIAAFLVVLKPVLGIGFVLGFIFFACICSRAELAYAILLLSFAIPVQKTLGGLPLNMSDAMIVVWGMAWPFLMLKKQNPLSFLSPETQNFEIPKVIWFALPFVGAAFISLIGAENFFGSFKQAVRLIEWFIILPVLFMSLQIYKRFWDIAALLFLIIPSFFALDGIVEVLNHGNSITHMLGIPVPVPPKELSEIRHTYDVSGRAGSTFGGAQGFAMYLTMMMAVIFAIVLKPPRPAFRVLGIFALLLCLGGLVAAQSRGGLLGFLVMAYVGCLLSYPKPAFKTGLIGAIILMLGLMTFMVFAGWDGTITGLIPGRESAVLDRLIIWNRAFMTFLTHPINGVGFGGFHDYVYDHGGIQLNVGLGYASLHSHNTYLEVLDGTGIIGFGTYLAFLILTSRHLLKVWKHRPHLETDCFILGAMGALSAYMMFGMVDMLFLQNMHMILVSILTLGFIAARLKNIPQKPFLAVTEKSN